MIEYVLQVVIIAIIFMCIMLERYKHQELKILFTNEGDLVKENLNHIASAIIGLSDLLDEADKMVDSVSQIPSMGEMIQQMIGSFMMQKMTNLQPLQKIEEMKDVIKAESIPEVHAEEKNPKETKKI